MLSLPGGWTIQLKAEFIKLKTNQSRIGASGLLFILFFHQSWRCLKQYNIVSRSLCHFRLPPTGHISLIHTNRHTLLSSLVDQLRLTHKPERIYLNWLSSKDQIFTPSNQIRLKKMCMCLLWAWCSKFLWNILSEDFALCSVSCPSCSTVPTPPAVVFRAENMRAWLDFWNIEGFYTLLELKSHRNHIQTHLLVNRNVQVPFEFIP